jgi:hypothetical protein
MKKKGLITALALTLIIGFGVTVYAASAPTTGSDTVPPAQTTQQRLGLGRLTGMRGYDLMAAALEKLGVTEEEIENGAAAGQTPYEIAATKGISADKFQAAILDEKFKAIDAAVENGNITKEQGDSLKDSIKTKAENCTTPGQNPRGMGGFNGCGSNGFGRGNGMGLSRGLK